MQSIIFFLSNHIFLSIVWIFCFFCMLISVTKNFFLKKHVINSQKAIQLINKDYAIVIDTRSLESFKKGHIVDSIHIPLDKFSLECIKQTEQHKHMSVILIIEKLEKYNVCAQKCLKYGFNQVFILKNSIHDWNSEQLPLICTD